MPTLRVTKEITIQVDFWLGVDEDDLKHDCQYKDFALNCPAFSEAADEAQEELVSLLEEEAEDSDPEN